MKVTKITIHRSIDSVQKKVQWQMAANRELGRRRARAGKRRGRKGVLGSYWKDWAASIATGQRSALRNAAADSLV